MNTAGELSVFEAHDHDGEQHWEMAGEVLASTEDRANGARRSWLPADVAHKRSKPFMLPIPLLSKLKSLDLEQAALVDTIELDYVAS